MSNPLIFHASRHYRQNTRRNAPHYRQNTRMNASQERKLKICFIQSYILCEVKCLLTLRFFYLITCRSYDSKGSTKNFRKHYNFYYKNYPIKVNRQNNSDINIVVIKITHKLYNMEYI